MMVTPMMTRRTVLGAGAALTAMVCAAGFAAEGATVRHRPAPRSIDALLVDETIAMPRRMVEFIRATRRTLPVVGVQLDAAAHVGLMRVLDTSRTVIGLSSGATLFCLERLGWDRGFRLTERNQWCASDLDDDAGLRAIAAFPGGTHSSGASAARLVHAYRPSRADGALHAWVMQKSARPLARQIRGEV
jgi:hypothetical protein